MSIVEESQQFAEQNVVKGCQEIVSWKNSGILEDGVVRELASKWQPQAGYHSLQIATEAFKSAAVRVVSNLTEKEIF